MAGSTHRARDAPLLFAERSYLLIIPLPSQSGQLITLEASNPPNGSGYIIPVPSHVGHSIELLIGHTIVSSLSPLM